MDTISAETGAARVSPRRAGSRRAQYLALSAFVVCYAALKIGSTASRSATFDEPLHLAAGYSALVERDYRIDPTHPPFARMWAAAPLVAAGARPLDAARVDASTPGDWLLSSVGEARRFLYGQRDADALLRAARLAVAFWGLVLGGLIFAWTREWLGPGTGLVALGLYASEPNLAAHAALVTTDLPVACFMFAASYFLWRDVRRPTALDSAALAICTALAIVTKFSGLLLLPVIVIMLAAFARRRGPLTWPMAGAIAGAVMAVTFAGIWAAYGFRYEPSATAGWVFHLERSPLVDANASLIAPAAAWLDAHHLLPNAFTQGALVSVAASRTQSMYLLGQISTDGWWYYFPLAFLIKTPLALVVLCACGVWAALRRVPRIIAPAPWLFIAVPLAVVILAAVLSGINIGVRHILAVYPFVVVLAAAGAGWLWRQGRRVSRVTAAGLATAVVVQFAAIYPHTLTFFSLLVGGPERATRYLADSNIDWGQHLNLVKAWMDRNRVDHINLAYFGTADPAYYGINATLLPGTPAFDRVAIGKPQLPGYVALSVNMLSGQYLPPEWRLYYREFRNRTPVAVLGNTIRVYWVDTWPEPGDDATEDVEVVRALARGLADIKAYRHAALHFREILERNPNDARALARLGVVLVESGEEDEGLRSLQVASDLAPGDARIRYDQGIALLTAGHVPRAESRAVAWLKLAPDDHRAHYLLAAVREAQDRPEDALVELDRALRIDPSFAPAREAMAALRPRP